MDGEGKRFFINCNNKFAVEQGIFKQGNLWKGIHVSKSKIKFADFDKPKDEFTDEAATSGRFKMWEPNFFAYAKFTADKAHNDDSDQDSWKD